MAFGVSSYGLALCALLLFGGYHLADSRTLDEIIASATGSVESFDLLADLDGNVFRKELDMMLTKEQFFALETLEAVDVLSDNPDMTDREKAQLSRKKRKAVKHLRYRWTNKIIPYKIAPRVFSSQNMVQVNAAIKEWEDNTCIRFRQARSSDSNYVYFDNGSGCYSYVGMIGGSQTIGLANGCRYKGVIAHEIGHAVGFHHEQNRPDRDEHVIIMRQNIPQNLYNNFKKYPWSAVGTYDVPYDYRSVMHYGGRAFSTNGQYTIKTRDPAYQEVIGNRDGLSFNDIKLANLMYKCNEQCDSSIKCPGNGFVGKDCRCYCPGSPVKVCDGSVEPTKKPVTTRRPIAGCEDQNEHCSAWSKAAERYCETNTYVQTYCKKSCNSCTGTSVTEKPTRVCKDVKKENHCQFWKSRGYCSGLYESFMKDNCAKTCAFCSSSPGGHKTSSNGLVDEYGDSDDNGSSLLTVSLGTLLTALTAHFLQRVHV